MLDKLLRQIVLETQKKVSLDMNSSKLTSPIFLLSHDCEAR